MHLACLPHYCHYYSTNKRGNSELEEEGKKKKKGIVICSSSGLYMVSKVKFFGIRNKRKSMERKVWDKGQWEVGPNTYSTAMKSQQLYQVTLKGTSVQGNAFSRSLELFSLQLEYLQTPETKFLVMMLS